MITLLSLKMSLIIKMLLFVVKHDFSLTKIITFIKITAGYNN